MIQLREGGEEKDRERSVSSYLSQGNGETAVRIFQGIHDDEREMPCYVKILRFCKKNFFLNIEQM